MLNKANSPHSHLEKYHLTIIYSLYAVFAFIFGYAYRFVMNPDGISQLRLAGYIAEGNLYQSVTSSYPPLFIWIMSPFLILGLDGLIAARLSIALCGAVLLLFSWLLASRFSISAAARVIAMLILATLVSLWTIQNIGTDVLFAATLLSYIFLLTDPDIFARRSISFLCGIAGGCAYLAHHYAFPFFLVHFPAILLAKGYIYRSRSRMPWRNILMTWSLGMIGFLIVSFMWISVVSVKNGRFIISSSGGPAHAVMGPKDVDRRHPFFVGGLFLPKEEYAIHVFEDPSDVAFKTWSPFESKDYFIHQLKVVRMNLIYIFNHFVNKSPFFTYSFVVGILVFVLIALCLVPFECRERYLYSWIFLTFGIYCSGFLLLIARSPRRFYALMIVFVFSAFHFKEELEHSLKEIISERRRRVLEVLLLLIICCAFMIKPSIELFSAVKHIMTVEQVNPYKEIADRIKSVDFPSPYAIVRSSQKVTTDYYLAYFLEKQLLGRPLSSDLDGITDELKSAGGKALLVFDKPELAEELKRDGRYVYMASITLDSVARYDDAEKWVVSSYEVMTGWDKEVDIFALR